MIRMQKRALVSAGIAATVVAASALSGGTSYASPRSPGACSVPSAQFPTIQSAVNAPACRVVKIAPGFYAENVAIARSLTLNGAKAGQDARSRRGGGESVLNAGGQANITVSADNVTIDGFTLNGPPGGGTAALVLQNGNTGETIQNTVIANQGRAASFTTSRTTFRRNLVKNTATAQDGFQANSRPVRDVTISGNTFVGPAASNYNADVTFIEGNANLMVEDNKSTANGTLVALFKTTGARVEGNTVVGTSNSSAIYIGGGNSKISVSGNTISSAASAVKVANDFTIGTNSGVGITRNTLRNNQYGVNVAAGSATGTVQVNRNTITGNALFGVSNSPTSGASTNATCNWWGAITGPGAVGPGRGDKVSPGVTYRPWLRLPGLALSCR